jgi:hypothetical protein
MEYYWTCRCCGKTFDTLPLDYAFSGPRNWYDMPDHEKADRIKIDSNLCVIDGKEFYTRGCLEIPIIGHTEKLVYGAWVSVSENSFQYILDHWDGVVPENDPPRFGWLCNWITGYPEPLEIRCHLYIRPNNQRPLIILEPTDYPLAVEQHNGITLDYVQEIARRSIMH